MFDVEAPELVAPEPMQPLAVLMCPVTRLVELPYDCPQTENIRPGILVAQKVEASSEDTSSNTEPQCVQVCHKVDTHI